MKGFIGEFEELVLLTIACLGDEAYGVAIKEDIEHRAKRGYQYWLFTFNHYQVGRKRLP